MSVIINEIIIESRLPDNFINATQLCKAGHRKFSHWHILDSAKRVMELLKQEVGENIIEIKVGGNHSGSWVHPRLATYIAQWISPEFSLKISEWIEEWKLLDQENQKKYMKELNNIALSKNISKEKELQIKLKETLGGNIEVKTPAGFIDLLTEKCIIEIKEFSLWKNAIGQILSYGFYFPNRRKQIYLFGCEGKETEVIMNICCQYDIDVILM